MNGLCKKSVASVLAGMSVILCGLSAMSASAQPAAPTYRPDERFVTSDLKLVMEEKTVGQGASGSLVYEIRENVARKGMYYAVVTGYKDDGTHVLDVPAEVPCLDDGQSDEDGDFIVVEYKQCPVGRIGDGKPLRDMRTLERVTFHQPGRHKLQIGDQAFRGAKRLRAVDMSQVKSVTICPFAFAETPLLSTFVFPDDYYLDKWHRVLPTYTSSVDIHEGAFYKAGYRTNDAVILLRCWTDQGRVDRLATLSGHSAYSFTSDRVFSGSNVVVLYYHPEGPMDEDMLNVNHFNPYARAVASVRNDVVKQES